MTRRAGSGRSWSPMTRMPPVPLLRETLTYGPRDEVLTTTDRRGEGGPLDP